MGRVGPMDPTGSGPTADEPESGAAPEVWGQPGAVGPARSDQAGVAPDPDAAGSDTTDERPLAADPGDPGGPGGPGAVPPAIVTADGIPAGTPSAEPPSGVAPEVWGQPGAVGPARGERHDAVSPTSPATIPPTGGAAAPSDSAMVPHRDEGTDDLSTWTALSPQVMVLWRLSYAIVATVVLAVVSALAAANDGLPDPVRIGAPLAVLAITVVAIAVIPRAEYRRWRYLVTDDGIELRHGLVVHHESSIPHFRVQHVDVRQGVLQRALGIVTLSISTASPATDAELPAVDPARAELIRARVLDRSEADDGV